MPQAQQQLDTDNDESVVGNENEEAQRQAEEQAEADLERGFKRARGESVPTSEEDAGETEPPPAKKPEKAPEPRRLSDQPIEKMGESAAEKKEVQPQPGWEDSFGKLNDRLRGLEGKIGGLMDKLGQTPAAPKATGGQPATVEQRIAAGLKNLDKIEELAENFEDFKPLVDALKDMSARLDSVSQSTGRESKGDVQSDQKATEPTVAAQAGGADPLAREYGWLDAKHEGWQEKASSPEFYEFTLTGGPKKSEYQRYLDLDSASLNGDSSARAEADRLRDGFQMDHPDWWSKKGQYLFSDRAADVSKLLTAYDRHQSRLASQNQQQDRNKRRLQQSAEPDTSRSGETTSSLSDEEALARGFNKVAKNRFGVR